MQSDLLMTLGALTLGGSIAVFLFAVTARFSRARYAARWRCWVWALLCLRLVIPFSLLGGEEEPGQAPIQVTLPEDTVIYEYDRPQQSARPGNTPSAAVSAAQPSAAPDQAETPAQVETEKVRSRWRKC